MLSLKQEMSERGVGMWNRFDTDRDSLNLYDNPHFEPGSGIMEYAEFLTGMKETFLSHKNEPHPIVKAKVIEFIADNAAIEVNPKDWFGFNFFGWFTPNSAQKVFEKLSKKFKKHKVMLMSAATGQGIKPVLDEVVKILSVTPVPVVKIEKPQTALHKVDPVFTITRDEEGVVHISGKKIDEFIAKNFHFTNIIF